MESVLMGRDFDLPLVAQMGLTRSHSAERIPWHRHPGFELLFLLEGATAYEFEDGSFVEVPGGHFLVVGPRVAHRASQNVRMPAAIFGVELAPDPAKHSLNTPYTRHELRWIRELLQRAGTTVYPFNQNLSHLTTRLAAEVQARPDEAESPLRNVTLRSLVCAALMETTRQLIERHSSSPTKLITAAAEYLRNRYQEPIRIPDLVRHLGFSRARTFQLFKSSLGVTPNDYLQRVRIEKAKQLLRHTRRTVTEIAMESGFNSSQYFSTVFRRYTGDTPVQFRDKNSKVPRATV